MNHDFANPALLEEALTHTSWVNEHGGKHNERLEFLGDAVLQVFASELLFSRFPEAREGVLSHYRAELVNTIHLAKVARRMGLDKLIRLGKGGPKTGVSPTNRVLAGLFEAVLGAIYMDGGFEVARRWLYGVLEPDLHTLSDDGGPRKDAHPLPMNPRRVLHEWCQKNRGEPSTYVMQKRTGPDYNETFTMAAFCKGVQLGTGTGPSKKTASTAAAKAALSALGLT